MTNRKVRKLAGRAVPDERGNQTWVWQADADVNTAVVRALGEGLIIEGQPAPTRCEDSNPYDRIAPQTSGSASKRRTLDDMRKLSEAIKRSKRKPGD